MPTGKKTTVRKTHHTHSAPSSTTKGIPILKKRATENGKVGNRSRQGRANGAAAKDWNTPLTLDREELMTMLQECLTDFATEVGLKVACLLFDRQVEIRCEPAAPKPNGTRRRRSVAKAARR